MNNVNVYLEYYNFVPLYEHILKKSVYRLAEWNYKKIQTAKLIAVPSCYSSCI